jgi:hypothetical protein
MRSDLYTLKAFVCDKHHSVVFSTVSDQSNVKMCGFFGRLSNSLVMRSASMIFSAFKNGQIDIIARGKELYDIEYRKRFLLLTKNKFFPFWPIHDKN